MLRRINDFEDVTVHDLHADYPDFMIEVEREQQLLLQNNVIILQHPFY
jgi:glutathione-regulated potassium-efflux system ancillary protein KefG